MTSWHLLTATLPTASSGLRVRIWRALRATGAGSLREGVYLLPEHAPGAPQLEALAQSIIDGGAQAHLLLLQARDEAQEQAFRALFDRTGLYAEFLQAVKETRSRARTATEAALRKSLRQLQARLQAIQSHDFFPGAASHQAIDALASLRRAIERRLSPDEPSAATAAIARQARAAYQGRTWATRQRPWVDRLATAWLVQRFIDARPTFLWLTDARTCPPGTVGFDFDGAAFTHVGERVTFEVVAEAFGLLDDPALQRLARLVHQLDVGGAPVEEAAGIELLLRGLQAQHTDDDDLLAAALPLWDACLVALRTANEH